MTRNTLYAALALLTACAGQSPPAGASTDAPQTSIPFVRVGAINDFEADSDRGIYLQNRSRKWFYASLNGPCTGLPFATRIGVDTRFGGGQLDNTGKILVDGQPCWINSLTKSGPPPRRGKKKS